MNFQRKEIRRICVRKTEGAAGIRICCRYCDRIDTFLVHHPYLSRKDVPAEMVTASGSGLDPHITPACAYVQVKRVAQARGMNEAEVKAIVDKNISKPFLGVFGTETVNVLELNIALEEADQNK